MRYSATITILEARDLAVAASAAHVVARHAMMHMDQSSDLHTSEVMLASIPQRLLGQMIDGLVGIAPLLLLMVPLDDRTTRVVGIGWILWMLFHYLLADGLPNGQSLGKRVVGTRVVSVSTGEPCTYLQSFVRNLLLAILGPLDWVFMFGSRRQRLGDMSARTIVVDA